MSEICLCCKATAPLPAEDGELEDGGEEIMEFHDIFDEVGLELQLPLLVEKYYGLKVQDDTAKTSPTPSVTAENEETPSTSSTAAATTTIISEVADVNVNENNSQFSRKLCADCMNRLIELLDLEEHNNELIERADQLQLHQSPSELVSPEDVCERGTEIDAALTENVLGAGVQQSLQTHQVLLPLVHSRPHQHPQLQPQRQHVRLHLQADNIAEYSMLESGDMIPVIANTETGQNIFLIDKNILNEMNDYDTFELVYQQPTDEESINERIPNEEGNENGIIQVQTEENLVVRREELERSGVLVEGNDNNTNCKDAEVIVQISSAETLRQKSVEEKVNKNRKKNTPQNGLLIQIHCEDENAEHDDAVVNNDEVGEDEGDDRDNENDNDDEEEDFHFNDDDDNSNNDDENGDNAIRIVQYEEENDVVETVVEEKDNHGVYENDSPSKQQDHGEENILTDVYEQANLNAYLDLALTTKFEDLDLEWRTVCKICSVHFKTFQELLKHDCLCLPMANTAGKYTCIFEGCNIIEENHITLARHFIIGHYPALNNLSIYGSCPECNITFSNFTTFNKHSCCRHIRRKLGAMNYCKLCKMDFPSHKRYVFHMQFHMTKCRPKICLICAKRFKNVTNFFKHVQFEHEPADSLVCTKCDRFFSDAATYRYHLNTHGKNDEEFVCSVCRKRFQKKIDLLTHQELEHPQEFPIKPKKCHECEKEYLNIRSFRNHIKLHQPEMEIYAFMCSECGLVTGDYDILKNHIEDDKWVECRDAVVCEHLISTVYTCENCYMDYQSLDYLRQHRSSSIHSDQSYKCIFCSNYYETYKQMRNHMKMHKNYDSWMENFPISRLFACNVDKCEEIYPLWTSLYYHKKRNHSLSNIDLSEYKCQFCQKLCPTKMSLAIHVARSHNNKNLRCPDCNYSYKDEKSLKKHVDFIHSPVQCEVCFKLLKNRRNFETHFRVVHKNEQRYFCKECQRGYFYRNELEQHMKYKHPAVLFECELCNFQTSYEKSYEIHLAKHNNLLEYKCDICEKSYSRKHVLTEHMKKAHYINEFVCKERISNGCTATFAWNSDSEKHNSEEHTENELNSVKLSEQPLDSKSLKRSNPLKRKEKRLRLQLETKNQKNYADSDCDDASDDNIEFVDYNAYDKDTNFSPRNENELELRDHLTECEDASHTTEDMEFSEINNENSTFQMNTSDDDDDDDGVYQVMVNEVAAAVRSEKVQST